MEMKRAIVLPYCVDQNEPSVPLRRLVEVPDDKSEHKAFLKDLFDEFFYIEDPEDLPELKVSYGRKQGYGDINFGDGESMFIFLTYVD